MKALTPTFEVPKPPDIFKREPSKQFNVEWWGTKCHECQSKNLEFHKAPAWYYLAICSECSTSNYVCVGDKMGGQTDTVWTDKDPNLFTDESYSL